MDIPEIERQKEEIVKKYGEWTSHSIQLAPDLYTVEGKETSDGRPAHYVRVIKDFFSEPLSELRVVDLACLEGMYSFEFAKHGSEVVGIEGRLGNIEKARFANRILGFNKCEFVQDDVRNLNIDKYGKFDVVFCCGIFYHLDAPDVFMFLERMTEVCKRLLLIDTQIAAEIKTRWGFQKPVIQEYKGQKYSGCYYKEDLEKPWEALNNPKSFWLDRKSLYRAIRHVGFSHVYEDLEPHVMSENNDRLSVVCLK